MDAFLTLNFIYFLFKLKNVFFQLPILVIDYNLTTCSQFIVAKL